MSRENTGWPGDGRQIASGPASGRLRSGASATGERSKWGLGPGMGIALSRGEWLGLAYWCEVGAVMGQRWRSEPVGTLYVRFMYALSTLYLRGGEGKRADRFR